MARKGPPFHVVLLAGGSGTRFWPLSRTARPKQFLSLASDRPLIVETWKRLAPLAPPRRRWVVAPRRLADSVKKALPGSDIKEGSVIRGVIVRQKANLRREDGSYVKFDTNALVIVDGDGNPKGTRIFGAVAHLRVPARQQ